MNIYKLKRTLISMIYTNRCPVCNEYINSNDYFCAKCLDDFDYYEHEPENLPLINQLIPVCIFNEKSSFIIYKAKRDNDIYAISGIAYKIYQKLLAKNLLPNIDVIVAAPMYAKDKSKKYNQAELIAKELSSLSNIHHMKKAIIKTKQTVQQKTLTGEERTKNLKNTFELNVNMDVKGKKVLIIDDVCTTGSTLCEIARVLAENGVSTIYAATFAKTSHKSKEELCSKYQDLPTK